MRKYLSSIIAAVLGVLLIVWGVSTLGKSQKGIGELDVVTGPLELVEGAEDPLFDIYVDSPILIRRVEMYQNTTDNQGNIIQVFSKSPIKIQEKDVNEIYKRKVFHVSQYDNPYFPSDIPQAVFFGKVKIGDEVILSDDYVNKFALSQYIDFSEPNPHTGVYGLEDGPTVKGLVPMDDSTYGTPGEDWEVGDLRVTWFAYKPEEFAEVYTAGGVIADGVIGPKAYVDFFYDRVVTEEEMAEHYTSSNFKASIIIFVLGAISLAVAGFTFVRTRKEDIVSPEIDTGPFPPNGQGLDMLMYDDSEVFDADTIDEAWHEIQGLERRKPKGATLEKNARKTHLGKEKGLPRKGEHHD